MDAREKKRAELIDSGSLLLNYSRFSLRYRVPGIKFIMHYLSSEQMKHPR